MNYENLTTPGLLLLHSAIARALAEDDNTPEGSERQYMVRETADWRAQGDLLEGILDRRGAPYSRLPW